MAGELRFELEERPGGVIVHLAGPAADAEAEAHLDSVLFDGIGRATRDGPVVVDLARAGTFSGDGGGLLFQLFRKSARSGVRCCLAEVPPRLLRDLELPGLSRFLPIYPSVAAALEAHPATQAGPHPAGDG